MWWLLLWMKSEIKITVSILKSLCEHNMRPTGIERLVLGRLHNLKCPNDKIQFLAYWKLHYEMLRERTKISIKGFSNTLIPE